MKLLVLLAAMSVVLVTGCFKVEVPDIDVDINTPRGGNGGHRRSSPTGVPGASGRSGGRGWMQIALGAAGEGTLGAEYGALFYAYDTLAYPPGPLLVSNLDEAFGDSGEFKTGRLGALTRAFPGVRSGIGDKASDAQAYVDNSLTAYFIPHYKSKPKDMRKTADKIRRLGDRGRLNVVESAAGVRALAGEPSRSYGSPAARPQEEGR